MRVISGTKKGTLLYALEGNETRPTLDRVKEAMFNILQMEIREANILDLFSGSGALGIESLSRGAKKVVFCDKSKNAIEVISKNLEKTHLSENAIIIKEDYKKALERLKNQIQFDFIFLDPPYVGNFVKPAVELIMSYDLLKKNGTIIIETDEEERILKEIKQTDVIVRDLRKYGRVHLIFLNRKG